MSDYSYPTANGTGGSYVDPYIISPLKEILVISFTVAFIFGLSGSLLVIFVIARNRSMHTVTNFFLANLAVADLFVSVFCIIPKLLWYVSPSWEYGDFLCKLHNYAMSFTTTCSVFILTVISLERFIAILRPLETRRLLTAPRLTVVMAIVWFASATFNIHTIWYYKVRYHGGLPYCMVTELMEEMVKTNASAIQNIVFFFLYYVIPLTIMLVVYGLIARKLWVSTKLRLVASDREKHDSNQPSRSIISRLSRVRYLVKSKPRNAPADDEKRNVTGRLGNASECTARQQASLDNKEEGQVLLESEVWTDRPKDGDQKIGPFYLDDPDDDPSSTSQQVRIKVDLVASSENRGIQETRLVETGNAPPLAPRRNGQQAVNNNFAKDNRWQAPRRSGRANLSTPRPLTISKSERSKNKKNKKKETITARKKVIKLLVVVVISFALCLLPYQFILLWMTLSPATFPHSSAAITVMLPMTYLCYFLNSALNPFLYAFFSDNFRKRMRETLSLGGSSRRKNWIRTQARLRSMTEVTTETDTAYTT